VGDRLNLLWLEAYQISKVIGCYWRCGFQTLSREGLVPLPPPGDGDDVGDRSRSGGVVWRCIHCYGRQPAVAGASVLHPLPTQIGAKDLAVAIDGIQPTPPVHSEKVLDSLARAVSNSNYSATRNTTGLAPQSALDLSPQSALQSRFGIGIVEAACHCELATGRQPTRPG
jgi:hypothetical protein